MYCCLLHFISHNVSIDVSGPNDTRTSYCNECSVLSISSSGQAGSLYPDVFGRWNMHSDWDLRISIWLLSLAMQLWDLFGRICYQFSRTQSPVTSWLFILKPILNITMFPGSWLTDSPPIQMICLIFLSRHRSVILIWSVYPTSTQKFCQYKNSAKCLTN